MEVVGGGIGIGCGLVWELLGLFSLSFWGGWHLLMGCEAVSLWGEVVRRNFWSWFQG